MGQDTSRYLDCRLFNRDNSSELKHQELLRDLRLMQQEEDLRATLTTKQSILIDTYIPNANPNSLPHLNPAPIFNHDHILKYSPQPFPKAMEFESGGFIEIPDASLSDVLQPRMASGQFLPAGDVHALIGGLLSAMAFLEESGISHHDIYPSSIYHSNSRYKLSNPVTAQSSYSRAFEGKRFSFLSPQLVEALVHRVPIEDHSLLFKPDVYSLGMVLLECCSLKSSSQCYDPETYQISEANIQIRLAVIDAKYPSDLGFIIRCMLEGQPKSRMSATQLFSLFKSQAPPQQKSLNGITHLPSPPPAVIPVRSISQNTVKTLPSNDDSRDYMIMVTPPPLQNQPPNASLKNSMLNQPLSRTIPVSVPVQSHSLVTERGNNRSPNPIINLKQIDGRIDKILATSGKYS